MAFFRLSRSWQDRLRHWRESTFWWLGYPWHILQTVFGTSWSWLSRAWLSRRFHYFVHGIPALIAMMAVGVGASFVFAARTQERKANMAQTYVAAGKECVRKASMYTKADENDLCLKLLSQACTYLEKAQLLQREGDKDETTFVLARALNDLSIQARNAPPKSMYHDRWLEFRDRSAAILRKLAPADDPDNIGYGPAHIWFAEYLNKTQIMNEDLLKQIEGHLLRAYEATKIRPESRDAINATVALGSFYVAPSINQLGKAATYLEKVQRNDPYQQFVLAGIYAHLKREEDATRMIKSAEGYYREQADNKLDNTTARLLWSGTLAFQERYPEALDVLRKGHVAFPADLRFSKQIADVYANWEIKLDNQKASLAERLHKIQEGLKYIPAHPLLLNRLMTIIDTETGPEAEAAKQQMATMLVVEQPPCKAYIHFLLGNKAHNEKNEKEAVFHWEQALSLDKTLPLVVNNLAWIYAHQKEPKLDLALEMMEKLISQIPHVVNFYGTRGEILVLRKEYKAARTDLEKAVSGQKENLVLWKALLIVYEKLELPIMAEAARKRIEELKAKQAPQPTLPTELKPAPTKPGDTTIPTPAPKSDATGAPKVKNP